MKKELILILFLAIGLITAKSQIEGGFYTGQDSYGNKYVYFKGTNVSQYNLYFSVTYYSERANQYHTINYSPLNYNNYFTIGPANNWTWQPGEKVLITYSNGYKVLWEYSPKKKDISFGDGYKRYPCPVGGCLCTVYKPKGVWDTDCENCGHAKHKSRY